MKKFFIILFFVSSSCATITTSYTPKTNNKILPIIENEDKKDITFSVSYSDLSGLDTVNGQIKRETTIVKTLRKIFNKTNLFKKIKYTIENEKGDYHYHIDIKVSGTTPIDRYALAYMSGSSLMLIPIWLNFNIDASMFVYKENKEIYSITTVERIRDIYWLPTIILTPFLNHLTTITYVKNKILNYFMSEIIKNKLY